MSMTENHRILHNMRGAADMAAAGMKPPVIQKAFEVEGIPMTLKLAEALSEPGAIEGLSKKYMTHDVVKENIAGHQVLQATLQRRIAMESEIEPQAREPIEAPPEQLT